jgi:hypothetical protein
MRGASPARVTSLACAVLLAGVAALVTPPPRHAIAVDQDDEIQKEEAKKRKERYTNWMRDYSKDTTVQVKMPGEDEESTAELASTPVFRYSSQTIADDATLWLWTRDARPVALQKVEVNNYGGGRQWTICFGSVSEGLVTARWPGTRRYAATQPGVTYRPIPGAAAPSDRAKTRTAQLKTLKGRFSGLIDFTADGKGGTEMTAITTPLYEYADKDSKLPLGAIFSMVHGKGNLNPGFLLILEARPIGAGKWRWEYGSVRLGTGQVLLRLDDVEVWRQGPAGRDRIFDNWTYYFMPREFE